MSEPEKDNPRSPERATAQRNRILDASEQCFIQYGFHAASMARIAETAGISQGLAYRYFKNKSAIILAIIERQLAEKLAMQASKSYASIEEYVEEVLAFVRAWAMRDPTRTSPVLFLEFCAEASRDPDIADAMKKADRVYLEHFGKTISRLAKQAGKTLAPEEIESRFYAVQCLVEGVAAISGRRPQDLDAAREAQLRSLLKQIFTA